MIAQLKYNMFLEIFGSAIGNTILLIISIVGIYNYFVKKKTIIPNDNTYIKLFGKETTFLTIVCLPIILTIPIISIKMYISIFNDYVKYKQEQCSEDYFELLETNRGGKYQDRYVKIKSLEDKKVITIEIPNERHITKNDLGSCYYVQYSDKLQYGVFAKKIDCVTKETIESYCDLDVCK